MLWIGLILSAGCSQAQQNTLTQGHHWVGTWASSAQEVETKLMPSEFQQLNDTTLRQIVRVSIGGSAFPMPSPTGVTI